MPEETNLDFSPVSIKNASVQVITKGTQAEGKRFGCMGTLSAETEVATKTKNCEGTEKVITIPKYMTVTVEAHIQRDVIRDIFGVSTDGLKTGIYSYGIHSKGKRFVFTADEIDEFEDVTQLIAFPECSNMTGLSVSIDNDADEVAYVEVEFRANADTLGNFYYEAMGEELDTTTKNTWHKKFDAELVQDTAPEG